METFEQVWESSRENSFSWIYPAAMWSGVSVLIALSFVKHRWLRRIAKLAAIGCFSFFATIASGQEIQEKWRIRREWADLNPDKMTESGLDALYADGANLAFGPLIFGFFAFLLFTTVAVVLSILRVLVNTHCKSKNSDADGNDEQPGKVPEFSDNPYHPPNIAS